MHPYLDGNGSIGRLLITLFLCAEKNLDQPLLYLSAFFEKHRRDYYRLLLAVSQRGEWSAWIDFFLRGIAEQSNDAIHRTEKLLALQKCCVRKLQDSRASIDQLFRHPVLTISQAAKILKITPRAASLNIDKLVKAGILIEATGRERNRLFVARKIIQITEAEFLDLPPTTDY